MPRRLRVVRVERSISCPGQSKYEYQRAVTKTPAAKVLFLGTGKDAVPARGGERASCDGDGAGGTSLATRS